MRRFALAASMILIAVGVFASGSEAKTPSSQVPTTASTSNFELVGQNPLFGRGMNSAIAVFGDHLYVGNRTDGSDECVPAEGVPDPAVTGCPHIHPGVLVVDIKDPANPTVVGEIGAPNEGNVRETSRELRVWPQQRLLIVQNMRCSNFYHACPPPPPTPAPNFRFYDLSRSNAAHPKLVSTYFPNINNLKDPRPHEFFLWVDPDNARRALLYWTTFSDDNGSLANLIVTDISKARQGIFKEVARINVTHLYPGQEQKNLYIALHSLTVTPDGSRAYLAVWGGTFLTLDTTQITAGVAKPEAPAISPIDGRPFWPNPNAHSAVKVPGRPYVVMVDEIYGDYDDVNDAPLNESGCPWGWMHFIDITDEAQPTLLSEYKTLQNDLSFCATLPSQDLNYTSYATHNLTVLPDLVFDSWHSSGLQAVDIIDPANPTSAGEFIPEPLASVATEDPALSRGIVNHVVMWSYPIIKDGLIYVVDIRNGLYVLRYTGPHAAEVQNTTFLEGNSNLGDAVRLEAGS